MRYLSNTRTDGDGMTATAPITLLLLAVSLSPAAASMDDPRQDRRYKRLHDMFSKAMIKKRPLEQSCKAITGPTGTSGLDRILAPYLARQTEIADGAARFPILDCVYSAKRKGRDGRVIMMNPPADQLAAWIVTSCRQPGVRPDGLSESDCMAKAARMIWMQSNAQFPITGYLPEPAAMCDALWASNGTALFGFRDGVTVSLAGTPHEPGNEPRNPCGERRVYATCTTVPISAKQIEAALTAPVTKVPRRAYSRLSNLPIRAEMPDGDASRCPLDNGDPPEWLTRARTSYLTAIGASQYRFLERSITLNDKDPRFSCRKLWDAALLGPCASIATGIAKSLKAKPAGSKATPVASAPQVKSAASRP